MIKWQTYFRTWYLINKRTILVLSLLVKYAFLQAYYLFTTILYIMFIHTYTGKNSQEVRLTIKPIEQNTPNSSESLAFVGFYIVQHLLFGL